MSRLSETEEALKRIEAISASSMNQATAKQILNISDAVITTQLLKEKFKYQALLVHPDKLHQLDIPDDQKRVLIERGTRAFGKVNDACICLFHLLEQQESAARTQGERSAGSAQPPVPQSRAAAAPGGQATTPDHEETLWDSMRRSYSTEYAKVQKDFQDKLEKRQRELSEEPIKQLKKDIQDPPLRRLDLCQITEKYEHSSTVPFFNIPLGSPGPELKAINDCVQDFYSRGIDRVPRSRILEAIESCVDQKGAKSHRVEILMNPSSHPDDKSGVSKIIREIGEKYNAESHRLQEEMTRKYQGPRQ